MELCGENMRKRFSTLREWLQIWFMGVRLQFGNRTMTEAAAGVGYDHESNVSGRAGTMTIFKLVLQPGNV